MASSAARTVRPVYSTSSTRRTLRSSSGRGMDDAPSAGKAAMEVQSSRYRLMSRVPRGMFFPVFLSRSTARRRARSTPRRWMPTRSRRSASAPCPLDNLAGQTFQGSCHIFPLQQSQFHNKAPSLVQTHRLWRTPVHSMFFLPSSKAFCSRSIDKARRCS